jgi:hypothetical protein
MNIIETLKSDYQRFPDNQTYSIYAEDVFFKDPLNKFKGLERYKLMIQFIKTFFLNCKMDLHDIHLHEDTIKTEWTLSWNTPLPWKPYIAINGWSQLRLNAAGLICEHIDYWNTSPISVIKQHFQFARR